MVPGLPRVAARGNIWLPLSGRNTEIPCGVSAASPDTSNGDAVGASSWNAHTDWANASIGPRVNGIRIYIVICVGDGWHLGPSQRSPTGLGPRSPGSGTARIWEDPAGDLRTPSSAVAESPGIEARVKLGGPADGAAGLGMSAMC